MTVILWVVLVSCRHGVDARVSCGSTALPECHLSRIYGRDPYCLVDPVCVSPFFTLAGGPRGSGSGVPAWQGIYVLSDPLLVDYDPLLMVALPNFVVFALLWAVALYAIHQIRSPGVRSYLALSLCLFYALEGTRWMFTLVRLSQQTSYTSTASSAATYAVATLFATPLIAGVLIYRRSMPGH
jgi:hypothetical protein